MTAVRMDALDNLLPKSLLDIVPMNQNTAVGVTEEINGVNTSNMAMEYSADETYMEQQAMETDYAVKRAQVQTAVDKELVKREEAERKELWLAWQVDRVKLDREIRIFLKNKR